MKSLWNDAEARKFAHDPLQMRVYTSRLIGREPSLVLHGGGNTSVKAEVKNLFGETEEVLYIKGSGWDLATIEAEGFSPVRLDALKKMAQLDELSDSDMVRAQRAAMTDPAAPNPSVEAILHAIIPFKFVDHTHADAVAAISNTEGGEERIRSIYCDNVIVIPYFKAGFILAKKVSEMTRNIYWNRYEGMVLLNHGIFSFHDDARTSYERMINLVSKAEEYLEQQGAFQSVAMESKPAPAAPLLKIAQLRREVSSAAGTAMLAQLNSNAEARGFANLPDVSSIATRGPLTPDYVFRAKHIPMIISGDIPADVKSFADEYRKYFDRNTDGSLTCLDYAPRWAVWQGQGIMAFGKDLNDIATVSDISRHTIRAVQWGESLGGWNPLPEKDIFDIEYWELEQAKLKTGEKVSLLQGKIALITGAAGGIGKACAETLAEQGAAAAALDINPEIEKIFDNDAIMGITCDVLDQKAVQDALEKIVTRFGGIDIIISNAGSFPSSMDIEKLNGDAWNKSMEINLNSHQRMLQACIPFLKYGIDPAVVIIGSKNVPAPGPGAGAYSVAKAGLTQLARVAALELAPHGIRVNVIHPHLVSDTGIWTAEVLEGRAKHYGLSVEEYKTNNLLKTEVKSKDVAALALAMVSAPFAKTTGAQVPIDGGNERVI